LPNERQTNKMEERKDAVYSIAILLLDVADVRDMKKNKI